MNILLIGLRCSGKTTVGRLLASKLGREFVDLDDVTPSILGAADVRDAWNRFGEPAFRRAETVALARELTREDRIIALGGGTPTAELASELIRHEQARGVARVVYLRANADLLRARLAAADNRHRPGLTGDDPVEEVGRLLASRDPLYTALADDVVEVATKNPGEVAEVIAAKFA